MSNTELDQLNREDKTLQSADETCSSYDVENKRHILVYVIIFVLGIAVFFISKELFRPRGFTHPDFEVSAMEGKPVLDEEMFGYSALEITDGYTIYLCGVPGNNGQDIDMYLTNPKGNNVWFMAEIADSKGNVLGKSGVLKQNEYVKTIKLDKVLPDRETPVSVNIIAFEPKSWQSKGTITLNLTIYKDYR